ncbi:MAG: DegT/DnrJ/EryC1/StrS family aminotransferase [Acidobacteria bacterium]|nr:DegT/DnrJ/EryC1/StrS family aminotransferase [Acidobacteriota bacterium]
MPPVEIDSGAVRSAIPMVDLSPVLERAAAAIAANLRSMHHAGSYILGPQVRAFESELASSFGSLAAVGVGTGTAAIELALRCEEICDRGKEVIVPALTSLFTAQAVLAAGATPRFADVDPQTLLLDVESLERAWTPRTAAVVAVHLYGQVCNLPALEEWCRQRRLVLVQDACQAHGVRYQGRPLTDFSPYAAYSFYPTKNLGCLGDGGALLLGSQESAQKLSMLRDGGRRGDQTAVLPAINSRLDEMHACYLRALLPELDHWNRHRAAIAQLYDQLLSGCAHAIPVARRSDSVNHLYVVRTSCRDALRQHLAAHGIGTGIHYPAPLHQQPAFLHFHSSTSSLPHAESACREILSLPLGPHIDAPAATSVAGCIRRFRP